MSNEEKTLGRINSEATLGPAGAVQEMNWEYGAQAAIAEWQRRNGEPVARVEVNFLAGRMYERKVTWHGDIKCLFDEDRIEHVVARFNLYLAPQPEQLPSVEKLRAVFEAARRTLRYWGVSKAELDESLHQLDVACEAMDAGNGEEQCKKCGLYFHQTCADKRCERGDE